MTHSPLHSLRPQPLQSPVAFPPSTHAHTSAAARLNIHLPPPPLPSSPLSTTRMPSSLEEPHNYFLWETYCSRSPLSLITIKQKREEGPGVLLWCCLLLAPLLFSPRQMAERLHVNTTLNTQHHIPWQRGDVKHGVCVKQIVKIWMQICWLFFFNFVVLFWGCDVSLTKASMLFCYKLNSSLAIRVFWSPLPVKTLFLWRKPKRWGFECVQGECGHHLACTAGYEACLHIMHSRNTKLH